MAEELARRLPEGSSGFLEPLDVLRRNQPHEPSDGMEHRVRVRVRVVEVARVVLVLRVLDLRPHGIDLLVDRVEDGLGRELGIGRREDGLDVFHRAIETLPSLPHRDRLPRRLQLAEILPRVGQRLVDCVVLEPVIEGTHPHSSVAPTPDGPGNGRGRSRGLPWRSYYERGLLRFPPEIRDDLPSLPLRSGVVRG